MKLTEKQLKVINRTIAEKVYGATIRLAQDWEIDDYYSVDDFRCRTTNPILPFDKLRDYPTDITDAMALWEHFRNTGTYCCMTMRSPTHEGWEVEWTKDDHEVKYFVTQVETLPLAICLIVLQTLGLTVKDLK
jgi:hypothetical protein